MSTSKIMVLSIKPHVHKHLSKMVCLSEKNRHLLDMDRSLLLSANIPKYLWGEVVLCASHLINRLPSNPLQGHVPFDVLSEYVSIPSLNTLPARVFDCVAYVYQYKN